MVCVSFFAICLHYAVVLLSGNNPWRFPQPVPNRQSLTVTDVEVIHDGIMYFPWWVCPSGKELPGVVLLPFALHVYPFCVFYLGQWFSCIWFSFSFFLLAKRNCCFRHPWCLPVNCQQRIDLCYLDYSVCVLGEKSCLWATGIKFESGICFYCRHWCGRCQPSAWRCYGVEDPEIAVQ